MNASSSTLRPINKIAAEIHTLWWEYICEDKYSKYKKKPAFVANSMPYLEAMLNISCLSDVYGVETADDIVLRFIYNAGQWRGDDARRIKAELNAHLEAYKNARHS